MSINPDKIANVDINLAAMLLMLGVLVMVLRKDHRGDKAATVYLHFVITTLILAVDGLALEFVEGPVNSGFRALAIGLETFLEFCINIMLLQWFMYTFFIMYDSMDYLKRRLKIYLVPIIIIMVLDIINIFTGILWYYDEDLVYHDTWFYSVHDAIRYFYLVMSIYHYIRYKKENGAMKFFSLWPFLVPMLWGTLVEVVTEFTGFTLGASIGVAMLYILTAEKSSYIDEESGFYNLDYLMKLHERVVNQEAQPGGILRFSLPEGADAAAFCGELKSVMPDTSETYRIDAKSFTTVVFGNTRGLINMLSTDISTIAGEHDMDVKISKVSKKKGETPVEFFENNMGIDLK